MDIKVPKLGEEADSGSVTSIFVKEGYEIKKDDPIVELESEKAIASIPSTASGKVTKVHVSEGDTVKVGDVLVSVDTGGEEEEGKKEPEVEPKKKKKEAKAKKEEEAEEEESAEEEEGEEEERERPQGVPAAAAPSLRKLARRIGIDLRKVQGSERGGRIVLADIKNYIQRLEKRAAKAATGKAKGEKPATEKTDFAKWGEIAKNPMSQLRRVIARRMHESWSAIPHVTQFDEADMTNVLALKKKYDPAYRDKGTRLTVTPFILKAVVETLAKHRMFNASLDAEANEIVLKGYFHIGIAVDTDQGLLVPVLRDVNKKSMLDISKELEALAQRAKDRKLSADDMRGGTFTISNQGGIGGAHFTPIINAPEVAILGIGRGAKKPVVKNDKIEPRLMVPLCLSYDHRVIDGADAARFIVDLVRELEEFKEEVVKV